MWRLLAAATHLVDGTVLHGMHAAVQVHYQLRHGLDVVDGQCRHVGIQRTERHPYPCYMARLQARGSSDERATSCGQPEKKIPVEATAYLPSLSAPLCFLTGALRCCVLTDCVTFASCS